MSKFYAWAGKFSGQFEIQITIPSTEISYFTILAAVPSGNLEESVIERLGNKP